MRLVVAKRLGIRGEGLGNELIPWAKGWIAGQVLNAGLVGPSWGLNRRKYYRNFGTSRVDFVLEDILLRLPHHEFTEQDHLATGETDFGRSIERWASSVCLPPKTTYVVSVGGMFGGYLAIHNARAFLTAKLLGSRNALSNVYQIESTLDREKLFVAVHMRLGGDFSDIQRGETFRGQFNKRVPGEWYLWVCTALERRFPGRIEFHFFTDRRGPEFLEAVRRFNPGQQPQGGLTECSDLLLMARADLRVCSISSYSLSASFLSGGPYLWYEPQLTLREGCYSLWGDEAVQRREESPTARSAEHVSKLFPEQIRAAMDPEFVSGVPAVNFMGTAIDVGDPLPQNLVLQLENRLASLSSKTNLIDFGSLPCSQRMVSGAR